MRLDLHCHSTHSDGSFPATEVAQKAKAFGVELFCLTDHDTFAGHPATAEVLADTQCRVLRGLELSCKEYGQTVHLLLYGLREGPGLGALASRLETIAIDRRARLRKICNKLETLGIELDADAILSRSHGRTAGRPDVARALLEAGVVSSPREAFTRFLRDDGPAYVDIDRLGVGDGLALARGAGAKVSLAHPHTMRAFAQVQDLFERFRDQGLEGIEAFYGNYGRAESRGWLRLARTYELVATGGSDFHGDMTPLVARPGIELAEPHADRLLTWLHVR
jgi:hypothetical protein